MKNSFKIYLFSLLIFTNFMICSSQEVQRYYVDSTNGSDDNNGFLEGAAWQSIGKVNQSTFLPGDEILFKSGLHLVQVLCLESYQLPHEISVLIIG